jgi:molybdenum cofactor synthesis domain-containing protein
MSAQARVLAVCLSGKKGTAKQATAQVELVAAHGVQGDAHAGPGHRQVSMLDVVAIDEMRAHGLALDFGAFGENIVTEGLALDDLGLGSELAIGAARLVVTQIGKTCHDPCAIFHTVGHCIMPDRGVFLEVLAQGQVKPGDEVRALRHIPRSTVQVAIITVSDRAHRGERQDASGPALRDYVEAELGAHVALHTVVPDDREAIVAALSDAVARRGLDLVLTTGGTGCGPRDVTPEATRTVLEREVPGLAEQMRARSLLHTPHAMLSRAIAGLAGRCLIINLPGSPKGAVENLEAVREALPHAVELLRGEVADCAKATDPPRPIPRPPAPSKP